MQAAIHLWVDMTPLMLEYMAKYQTIGVAPITHISNENSNTQGSSPNVDKRFPYLKELLLKEKNSLPLGANYFL